MSAGSAGTAGGDAGPEPAVCGDGVRQDPETCDGSDFGVLNCTSYGFDTGTLVCTGCATIDPSGCSGSENCFDGRDNDGDRLTDCDDDECVTACADTCTSPPLLADPAQVTGDTTGHASLGDPSCALGPGSSEIAYAFTAAHTGVLDVRLDGSALSLSVSAACNSSSRELGCSLTGRLKTAIRAGDAIYVTVDGLDTGDTGAFNLSVSSREVACGDKFRDDPEACDDGNTVSDDGCSATCTLESSEAEPNDAIDKASLYVSPFFGDISGASDLDVVAFTLTEPARGLTARTSDFGDSACALGELDSVVEILDSNGAVLASDDDGGEGLCSLAVVGALTPGTYYVRVSAAAGGDVFRFPYVLAVTPALCGNGIISPGETCDDGNLLPADGCSDTCQRETTP
jgi:cysteine-rich repeat protein